MPLLEYSKWENFQKVIKQAMIACESSGFLISDHFPEFRKVVEIGSNTKRLIRDYRLSRYACYLIVQNADSHKEVIALGQTYFAIQTRRKELDDVDLRELPEDQKRLYRRKQIRSENYSLNITARDAGVKNFDQFHNAGYKGLYNGETADDIAKRKKLRYREDILDNMCSEEMADNLFRIAQAEAKIKRENLKGEDAAKKAHYEIANKVRQAIKDMGGTMPEDLPTPKKSLKQIEKETSELRKLK